MDLYLLPMLLSNRGQFYAVVPGRKVQIPRFFHNPFVDVLTAKMDDLEEDVTWLCLTRSRILSFSLGFCTIFPLLSFVFWWKILKSVLPRPCSFRKWRIRLIKLFSGSPLSANSLNLFLERSPLNLCLEIHSVADDSDDSKLFRITYRA